MKSIMATTLSLTILGCLCMTSCNWNREKTDGEFIYKYENLPNSGKCYSIIGTTEEGQKYKENVYVPTHFNGLPVYYTFTTYTGNGGALGSNTMPVNCKNLYFNYMQKYDFVFRGQAEYIFVPVSNEAMSRSISSRIIYTSTRVGYVSRLTYSYIMHSVCSSPNVEKFNETNGYILSYYNYGSRQYSIITANTSYMFNYKDSPNNDYFFINNFESESLIEDTPYEPIREGYSFAAWYKEPECINEWDFEEDRLPKFEYDADGYITNFVETKLYAKWIKE